MGTLRRRLFIGGIALIMLAAGYTAGFLLAPPKPQAISRIIPDAPVEAPQPEAPLDIIGDV
jgi:hypothetical protein